ncbi:UNVERIFIED_CONTAM: putative AC transposase [Sesamum calycinum]|uniref:AC transposase n=1 Tax=Sesamum calycinum TaxID=2727403 RepID=A0AAW2NFX5_9LAMI
MTVHGVELDLLHSLVVLGQWCPPHECRELGTWSAFSMSGKIEMENDYSLSEDSSSVGPKNSKKSDSKSRNEEFDQYVFREKKPITIRLYFGETLVDRNQFLDLNVLDYWRGSSARYPELALMARDVLSIPIATVAFESAFSHGGRIIGKFCSSILPTNAEAILCGRDWLECPSL